MRRRLIVVFVAVSTMVALAFVVPLGALVKRTAEDRALDSGLADATAVVPVLAAGGSRAQLESAVASTVSGRDGRMTIFRSNGWVIGPPVQDRSGVDAALASGGSSVGGVDGGLEVVRAVASGPDELSVVRVEVPDSLRREGLWQAWSALAGVAVALVAISVVVADRLARSIVRPAEELAGAAHRLGHGELQAKVEPAGPPELIGLAESFNELGQRVSSMLARERELTAELSHRLRTPLTRLRLRIDHVHGDELRSELQKDVDSVTMVVNELIDEARSVDGRAETCDAAVVAAERAEFWSALADEQSRSWAFERDHGHALVNLAESDLAAAIDVLIDNVFAHTPEETPIALSVEAGLTQIRIAVADGGEGLDSNGLERGASGAGSTGLGLDIARTTAESCGGTMTIGVAELGGAEVALILPLAGSGEAEEARDELPA